jgi:CubicO group peptidase (beta-lactamase class C family)
MEINNSPESVGLSSERLKRIRPWMQKYLDKGKLPGATTLVARKGKVVFCESLGFGDIEAKKPLKVDSIHRFYSMTKPVTSVAVMMLYEQGLFQLDDPVSEFIPDFKDMQVYISGAGNEIRTRPAQTPITIKHLLTHTSGLTYGFFNEDVIADLYIKNNTDFTANDGPLEQVIARLAKLPLVFDPGSRWNYGVSTDVLGRLVEIWSGQTFDQHLKQKIFEPLNMMDTGFFVPKTKIDRFVSLYGFTDENPMALIDASQTSSIIGSVQTFSGGGGLVSTLGDYFRFTELLRRKGEFDGVRLLGRKTMEFMTCNHLPGDLAQMGQPSFNETTYEGIGFGLGFSVMLDPAKACIIGSPGEYAWGGAASTAFWIDPVEDMTIIFLTQLRPSSAYPIRRELRVLTYQAIID